MAPQSDSEENEESKAVEETKDGLDKDEKSGSELNESEEESSEEELTKEQKKAKKAAAILREKEEAKQNAILPGNSASKLAVNYDYVKYKAKKQFNSRQSKQKSKRNSNKDKGQMKGKEEIRDREYFVIDRDD